MMDQVLTEYFRCPAGSADSQLAGCFSEEAGYFRFGPEIVCYGRSSTGFRAPTPNTQLYDVLGDVHLESPTTQLPFDPAEIVSNLRCERYANGTRATQAVTARLVRNTYYLLRPFLSVRLRKHLQRARLKGWRDLAFPHWPVDTTVDSLLEQLMVLAIRSRGGKTIPFVWFWPHGKSGCAIMTHDVETQLGIDRSTRIMDMNDSFGIPASFQVIPEERYPVTDSYLNNVRSRGFEINVQDLNHDGHLYREWREFERRVAKINQYGEQYGAVGFRSGVLYRNQEWFDKLEFDYDMSVPNVAHLDPQRGGCCTVMPYFVGNLVELPVTTTQDYSLFHILNEHSTRLWEEQIGLILEKHGLINAVVHPDYITGPREEETYKQLLTIFERIRREKNVWVALPSEVSSWWRQRSQMTLVQRDGEWHVEGPGSERAQVAFAEIEDGVLTYNLAPSSSACSEPHPPHLAS